MLKSINDSKVSLELSNLFDKKSNFRNQEKKFYSLLAKKVEIDYIDINRDSLLTKALKYEYFKLILLILKNSKIDINHRDINRENALILICKNLLVNNLTTKILKEILFKLSNVNNYNSKESLGRSFWYVCKSNNYKYFKILFDFVCKNFKLNYDKIKIFNYFKDEYTPMRFIIKNKNIKMFKLLFEFDLGFGIYKFGTAKCTPLMEAGKRGWLDCINLLLEKEIVRRTICNIDRLGYTVIEYAIINGYKEVVKKFINYVKPKMSLILSIKHENDEISKFLIENNFDLNYTETFYNDTPLILASKYNQISIVKLLIDKNININFKNIMGFSALTCACIQGNKEIVKLLLEKKAKIEDELCIACKRNYFDIFKLLLNYDIDINYSFYKGWTPLMESSYHGNVEIVKILLEKGVDISIKRDGQTALIIAIKNRKEDVVKLFLDNNEYLKYETNEKILLLACEYGLFKIVKLILEKDVNINCYEVYDLLKTWYGKLDIYARYNSIKMNGPIEYQKLLKIKCRHTPLLLACKNHYINIVRLLLKNGVDINFNLDNDLTIFKFMCIYPNSSFNIAKLILENNFEINLADSDNRGPLIHICNSNFKNNEKIELIKILQSRYDINLDNEDRFGKTGLNYVCENFLKMIINFEKYFFTECLVNDNFFVDFENLMFLLKLSSDEFEKIILKVINNLYLIGYKKTSNNLFKKHIKDDKKNLLLISSCKNNLKGVVNLLIENNINLNFIDEEGRTALIHSVKKNRNDIVQLLISKGCNIFVKDKYGYKALEYACILGHLGIVKLLMIKDGYISNKNLNYLINVISNENILYILKDYQKKQRTIKYENLSKLLLMKELVNTTFGGKTLINNYDIRSHVGSFF